MERARRDVTPLPAVEPGLWGLHLSGASRRDLAGDLRRVPVLCERAARLRRANRRSTQDAGLEVFHDHDNDIAAMLRGRDLGEILDYVYREGSRFCLMFISADYAQKAWTQPERRSALARAIQEDEYVLPARFDDTELPGLRPTTAYVDLREIAPATLAHGSGVLCHWSRTLQPPPRFCAAA